MPSPTQQNSHWSELAYWRQRIDVAIAEPDPAESNVLITRCHFELSAALRQVLGVEVGANFHSWAVWGSRKAGVTIRQEDLDDARRDGTVVGGIVGFLVGLALGWALAGYSWWLIPAIGLLGLACGALAGRAIITRSRRLAARLILEGNRTVLADIGLQTARFIEAFHDQKHEDSARLEALLAEMRPGRTEEGGQQLLRDAFRHYYRARYLPVMKQRQESAYLANCLAVLHEHIRLEPYIKGAMPWIVRRCATKRLMQFDIGPVKLRVSHEVPSVSGLPFPGPLQSLDNEELVSFLNGSTGIDLGGTAPVATAASDWTRIDERMRYVVNLFRAMHLEPQVFEHPYQPSEA